MDDHRFDALVRTLVTQPTRRGVLRLLAGGALGGLLGGAALPRGPLPAGAAGRICPDGKRDFGSYCTNSTQCQTGFCFTPADGNNRCLCGPDPRVKPCGGLCGRCCTTTVANATAVCQHGQCGFACKSGFTRCNGACVVLGTNQNCLSCGDTCDAGQTCCVTDPTTGAGVCLNPQTNPAHCGTCGHACTTNVANARAVCRTGACEFACHAGFTRCGAACVRLGTNVNCEGCGDVCIFPEGCGLRDDAPGVCGCWETGGHNPSLTCAEMRPMCCSRRCVLSDVYGGVDAICAALAGEACTADGFFPCATGLTCVDDVCTG